MSANIINWLKADVGQKLENQNGFGVLANCLSDINE